MTKKSILITLLAITTTSLAFSQKALKMLFIGNSFTYTNDLPGKFKGIVSAAGLTVTTDEQATAGATVYSTNGTTPHVTNPTVYAKIKSQAWDFVVIQDNQGAYVNNTGTFGPSVITDNIRLRDSVKKYLPCCSVIWFSGWGPSAGLPQYFTGDNATKCNDRIDANFRYLNNLYPAKKEVVAPFGKAWNASMAAKPAINLYHTDGVHPGVPGQLLNASVLFATIFKQDPSGLNYNGGVNATDASYLRNLGYSIVTNLSYYPLYNLESITPVINYNGGVLSGSGTYLSYQWYKNNVILPGATSSNYTPLANGFYSVLATDANGCERYLSFQLNVTSVGIEENMDFDSRVLIYPNPVSDVSVIEFNFADWQNCSFEILNLLGQPLLREKVRANRIMIHKADYKSGIYFYKLTDHTGHSFAGKFKVM